MRLFVDTETTGLNRDADRIVQIAWIVTDNEDRLQTEKVFVIRPEGYSIPSLSSKVHGITTETAKRFGVPIASVLQEFALDCHGASAIVAHNTAFDVKIISNEMLRNGFTSALEGKTHVCTMRLSTHWCRIPKLNNSPGFKFPRLDELHFKLFGCYFEGAHDALADVRATRKCFASLLEKGVIALPGETFSTRRAPPPEVRNSPVSRSTSPFRSLEGCTASGNIRQTFSVTRSIRTTCHHCSTAFSVTLHRHEFQTRCPACLGLIEAPRLA